jgi:hypothetical protein
MIACRSLVIKQQLPSNKSTQGFMDSEYLLGLGTWATCQNGLITTCYNSLEMRLLLRKQIWALSLCPPLETVSKPEVLMGAWKCVYSNWKPSRERCVHYY